MSKNCPKCDTEMYPADDFASEKATHVCPECAPQFVLANSTTHVDVEDPLTPS